MNVQTKKGIRSDIAHIRCLLKSIEDSVKSGDYEGIAETTSEVASAADLIGFRVVAALEG